MSTDFALRFLVIIAAMLASGTFGYMLARYHARQNNALQTAMMSAEIIKMRRRASTAQAQAESAEAKMTSARRKKRRA